jgi:hypothetical protein
MAVKSPTTEKSFMKLTKPENDPRHLLDHVPYEQRQLHTNVLALRENLKQLSQIVTQRVHTFAIENSFSVSNMRQPMTSIAQSDLAIEFATTEAMLRTLENSPQFKEASAAIDPLLLAVAQVEARELQERQEAARAEAALNAAREAARQRAIEQAENDPAVLAAKRKLETTKNFETAVSAK